MFEARIKQGALIKKLVDAIKELSNEANWDVDEKGIRMQGMDSSHVCLISFDLDAAKFDHFSCDKSHTIGINLLNLSKILKCSSSEDVLVMKLNEDSDELSFVFEAEDRRSDFTLKLMEIECEQLGIPENQEYDVTAELPSADYARIVRDLSTIGENLVVSGGVDEVPYIKLSTSGEIGSASMTLRGSADSDSIVVNKATDQSFSARYLSSFSKGSTLSGTTVISMSKDAPVCVHFAVGEIGYLKYYLAPKIEDEEE